MAASVALPIVGRSGYSLPEGIINVHGRTAIATSLHLAQVAERLGRPALKNIGY